MYTKIIFTLVVTIIILVQVQGCKVYCLSCPTDFDHPQYYCCMEDGETEIFNRNCEYESTSTLRSTSTSTLKPFENRCPELETSPNACEAYKRIYPNPTTCTSDNDCTKPFDVCCDDACYRTKICKTYTN